MKKAIIFVLSVLLLLCSCKATPTVGDAPTPTPTPSLPVQGGQLRIAVYNFDTFNPLISNSQSVIDAMGLVYEGLMKRSRDLGSELCLAESFSVSDDGLEYTFRLRHGIKWHDGSNFTAKQVQYTMDTILAHPGSYYLPNLSKVAKYTVQNDYTITIRLSEPVGGFEELMCFPIIKDSGDENNFIPVGTGPYKYLDFDASKQMRLKASGSWWVGQTPYIDEVRLSILPDKDAAVYAFEAREVNVITTHAADLTKYNPKNSGNILEYNSDTLCYMALNPQSPIFEGKNVRRAVSEAIDRDTLVQKVMFNHATPVCVPINPDSYLYQDFMAPAPSDREMVRNILSEDGWVSDAATGMLKKEIGNKQQSLYFEILINEGNERRELVASDIADTLKAAGINAVVKKVDFDTYVKRIGSGDYAAYIGEVKIGSNAGLSVFASGQLGMVSPAFSGAIAAVSSVVGREERKKAYAEFALYAMEDAPMISLYFKKQGLLIDSGFSGDMAPVPDGLFGSVSGWYQTR